MEGQEMDSGQETVEQQEPEQESGEQESEGQDNSEEKDVEERENEDWEDSSDGSYNLESLPRDEQIKVKLVRNLLEEARDREENYFFRYSSPDITQTDVWVRGDMIKRSIRRANELDKYNTYNMVYMNTATLKAEGYCETTKAKCWEGHGPFTETFLEWDIKTPKDWVLELGDDFRWALDNKIGDQLYHIIDYPQPDRTVRVYVNDYRGWPARVEIYPPGVKIDSIITEHAEETYLYDDMDIGGVSEADVTPGR